jgi:hypothetical protein
MELESKSFLQRKVQGHTTIKSKALKPTLELARAEGKEDVFVQAALRVR